MIQSSISSIEYVLAQSEADGCDRYGRPRSPEALKNYIHTVHEARANGKKTVLFTGSVPVEIIYACGCVPVCADIFITRISEDSRLTSELIHKTDVQINPHLCGFSKTLLGNFLFSGEDKPDGYVSAAYPCNSHSTAADALRSLLGMPVFSFDMPKRMNESTIGYLAMQLPEMISYVEGVSGNKLDHDELKRRMSLSNRSNALFMQYAALRAKTPCPMSSRTVFLGEMMSALSPTEEMISLLENEIASFKSCTRETPEKHRVYLLHNMPRRSVELMDWLEEKYSAVTVMDGFGSYGHVFRPFSTVEEAYRALAEKMFHAPVQHGTVAPVEEVMKAAETAMKDFGADVPIFLGNAGCRHSWSITKMLSDWMQSSCGVSPLLMDIDNVDMRYKSLEEMKVLISEYMDTVINRRG